MQKCKAGKFSHSTVEVSVLVAPESVWKILQCSNQRGHDVFGNIRFRVSFAWTQTVVLNPLDAIMAGCKHLVKKIKYFCADLGKSQHQPCTSQLYLCDFLCEGINLFFLIHGIIKCRFEEVLVLEGAQFLHPCLNLGEDILSLFQTVCPIRRYSDVCGASSVAWFPSFMTNQGGCIW